jgi:hypothetical protein
MMPYDAKNDMLFLVYLFIGALRARGEPIFSSTSPKNVTAQSMYFLRRGIGWNHWGLPQSMA